MLLRPFRAFIPLFGTQGSSRYAASALGFAVSRFQRSADFSVSLAYMASLADGLQLPN